MHNQFFETYQAYLHEIYGTAEMDQTKIMATIEELMDIN